MRSQDCDEEDNVTKQEIEQHHNQDTLNLNHMLHHHHQQQQHQASSSRQWASAFRNPRIVRVSRAFGGKDRHSKVCTIRGLRDRRIRLSVPTAIQLYDLQDRLGLNQPSKVIDWLLEESKEDIDNLPPLQFPQGFNQIYPNLNFGESSSSFHHGNNNLGFLESFDLGGESSRTRSRNDIQRESFDLGGEFSRTRSRNEIQRESFDLEKGKWVKLDDQDQGFDSNQENFEFSNQSNKLYDHTPMNSHYNLGHLQHSLEQSGNVTIALMSSTSNVSNQNLNLESPAAAGDGSQLFFGPPVTSTMSSLFPTYPSYFGASHLQLFSSNSASQQHMEITGNSNLIRPFHHLMNSNNETDNQSSDNDSNS